MFRPLQTRSARRGNTLIVTISCLSLLLVVGLTAVYFTGDQAQRSHNQGQGGTDEEFPDNGMGAANSFVGSLLYGVPNSGQGLMNATRGHDLISAMYSGQVGSTIAYDGVGLFSEATPPFGVASRQVFVNHRLFPGMTDVVLPEYTGLRPAASPTPGPGQAFIPKNAPYTYPDLNNFFLAYLCPATGEVLVPSYHREGAFGSLAPGNPNWNNAQGKYLTLRPRRQEHPNFPQVPADADGQYRGDVRNRPGGYIYNGTNWVAGNDSIWIDIGMPVMTLPNGRRVKPLVAPLIIDLNSLLNLSVHGNMMGTNGAHGSNQGWGRWEVSLQKVLQNEGQAIVQARGNPQTRSLPPLATRSFDRRLPTGQQLPSYSAVAWTGTAGAGSFTLPGGAPGTFISSYPAYGAGYASDNAAVASHAGLFVPRDWSATSSPMRTFALSDTELFQSRHAGPNGYYATMDAGTAAPLGLRGGAPGFPTPPTNPPQQSTPNNRRMDPAHTVRSIFTTHSASLERTGLTPGSGQVQATHGTLRANGLQGVDMNRRLADYRLDPAQALSPTNLAPASVTVGTQMVRQAEADRQFFCRDIFARLIVALDIPATDATVDAAGNVTILAAPGAGYDRLRELAQLAVNMCDYRDEDEIITPFIWNPANPLDPFLNAAAFTANDLSERVVFGTEKTRLVINEAYSEQVNHPMDGGAPPTRASHVRFWVELLNPGNAATGGVDDGGALVRDVANAISPYRIEIARYTRPGAAGAEDLGTYLQDPANVTGSFNPTFAPEIRFQFNNQDGNNAVVKRVMPNAAVYDPAGNPNQGVMLVAPQIVTGKTSEFNPTAIVPPATTPPPPWDRAFVAPAPAGAANPQNAMAYETGTMPPAAADANRADYKRHVVLLRRLANPHLPESAYNPYITVDYVDHVHAHDAILRLMGENMDRTAGAGGYTDFPNRYAIGKVQPQAGRSVGNLAAMALDPTHVFPESMVVDQNPAAPVPNQPRHTFGRHNGATAAMPATATFVPGPPATLAGSGTPETIMTPFEWLPHMDRLLVNQVELLHVTTTKPHMLTQQFVLQDPANVGVVRKHYSSIFDGTTNSQLLTTPRMYRILELLRIQGHGENDPLHGRKHGLLNINTISDKRVWDSVFDAQAGNVFTQTDVDAMWNNLIASRTATMQQRYNTLGQPLTDSTGAVATNPVSTPIPGTTIYDTNSTTGDRPFLPFGVSPHTAASALPGGATAFGGGQGIDDTLLRRDSTSGVPRIFQNTNLHPYQQVEALRKIQNNFTTTSNTFAVWLTVGYFDVESEVDSIVPQTAPATGFVKHVTLGNEYFRKVPADSRNKFFFIVESSNVALDVASYQAFLLGGPAPTHARVTPFFTSVEQNVNAGPPPAPAVPSIVIATDAAGQVYTDGVPQTINPGTMLAVGAGANQEIVTVTSVTPSVDATGRTISTLTLAAPLTKNHYAGECVSNVVPGNPGPAPWPAIAPSTTQLQFDLADPVFRPVVPHWSRIQ